MTTYVDFAPTMSGPFRFSATFDGAQYNVVITWNIFGYQLSGADSWYVNVYDASGNLIVSRFAAGSAGGVQLASISWDPDTLLVTGVTAAPHGIRPGSVAALTVKSVLPSGYDGVFTCNVLDAYTFTYQMATDPGDVTSTGAVSYDVNLLAGYFQTSTLVWRDANNQFEVTP